IADAFGLSSQQRRRLTAAPIAGDHRHPDLAGDRLGLRLAPHAAHGLGRRADETHAGGGHRLGEIGVLGKKAVAWMDAVGPRGASRSDDLVDPEVTFPRRARADRHDFVGGGRERKLAVWFGNDGDGTDAKPPGLAQGAESGYAADWDLD